MRTAIGRYGIRNALLTSIAPTGTISLFAGNVSSGIEPVFAFSHAGRCCSPTARAARRAWRITPSARWRALKGNEALPDYFVNAQTLSPADHLAVQAAAQEYIDSSISKTINVPRDISFEEFKHVYEQAYARAARAARPIAPMT